MPQEVLDRLRRALREVGFGGAAHAALEKMPGGVPPAEVLAALERPGDARLATVLELFCNERSVPRPSAEEALTGVALDDLVEARLLELDGSRARGRVRLAAVGDLIVAGDPRRDSESADFVSGVSEAARTLARLVVWRPARTALDLGTGSGVLALLAARHAEAVTGIDISPRALRYARLNGLLNRIENVRWAEGEWFEPVRVERFDLVVSNPPYVISPDRTFVYRDGPFEGDGVSRHVVRESAEHLVEGGFATVVFNWIHPESSWEQPLREWVTDLQCDAIFFRYGSFEPLRYAMDWNRTLAARDPEAFAEALRRWAAYYKEMGVELIADGAVVLRRRSGGSNWFRAFQLDGGGPQADGGDQIERICRGCDFLTSRSAAEQFRALLSARWRMVDGHRIDQVLQHHDGTYANDAFIREVPGLSLSARIDPRVIEVLAGCDGHTALGAVLESTRIPQGLDRAGFHSLCLTAVRDLIQRGLMVDGPVEATEAGTPVKTP